jgi:hypothetical protein
MSANGVRLDKDHNMLWTKTVHFDNEDEIEEFMGEMSEAMEQLEKGFLVIDDITQFSYDNPEQVFETWAMLCEVYDFKVQTKIGKVIRIYGDNQDIRDVWEQASSELKAGVPVFFQPSFT